MRQRKASPRGIRDAVVIFLLYESWLRDASKPLSRKDRVPEFDLAGCPGKFPYGQSGMTGFVDAGFFARAGDGTVLVDVVSYCSIKSGRSRY